MGKHPPFDISRVERAARVAVISDLCSMHYIEPRYKRALMNDPTILDSLVGALKPFRQHVIFNVVHPQTGVRRSYEQAAALMGVSAYRVRAKYQATLADMARVVNATSFLPEMSEARG